MRILRLYVTLGLIYFMYSVRPVMLNIMQTIRIEKTGRVLIK